MRVSWKMEKTTGIYLGAFGCFSVWVDSRDNHYLERDKKTAAPSRDGRTPSGNRDTKNTDKHMPGHTINL